MFKLVPHQPLPILENGYGDMTILEKVTEPTKNARGESPIAGSF